MEFKLEKLNDSGAAETTYNGVTGSDSTNQGKCSFASLTPGSYRLTETKTAEGYTLLATRGQFAYYAFLPAGSPISMTQVEEGFSLLG